MIVKLTVAQLNSIRLLVDDADLRRLVLKTPEPENVRRNVLVEAPYVVWTRVHQALTDKVFTPKMTRRTMGGGQADRVPGRYYNALRSVSKAMNAMITHPALRSIAVEGWHSQVLYVWEDLPGPYSLIPIPGGRYVVLRPKWLTAKNGTRVTVWVADGAAPADDWLADEAVHLG